MMKHSLFEYNGSSISLKDIDSFNTSNRSENDSKNKLRENILAAIINDKIPSDFYDKSSSWRNITKELESFIKRLCSKNKIPTSSKIVCTPKAGRKHNYDFELTIDDKNVFKIEFKFNATKASETPQFVSPMKPSQYLDIDFEEYFYENYLPIIATKGNLTIPCKDVYLKTIHNNKVDCMKDFKEKYDTDKEFNKECKKIDKLAIKKFIESNGLNLKKLTDYLMNSQKNKIYMCYKDGQFYYDKVHDDLYKVVNVESKNNTSYICVTKSGMKIEVRLRFKNGCGLQFPAFQIKRKIPAVKDLKSICQKNNLKAPKLKKDICKMLDKNNIMY